MKKLNTALLLILMNLNYGNLIAQSTATVQSITPKGIFDKVYDRFGNQEDLANLIIETGAPHVYAVPTASCNAGYFVLYFDPGSIWTNTPQAQTMLCQVFTDISNFIQSPLSITPGVGPKINIFCTNTTGLLGVASQYYVFPANPTFSNQGVIDGQIQKAIISGDDPYLNLPITYSNASQFYHGYVAIGIGYSVDFGLTNYTNTSSFDGYSVFLHEALHALGFASLIDQTGISKLGPGFNAFSRYDTFLRDKNGAPLLTSPGGTNCPNSNLSYTALLSAINPGLCTNNASPADITTCSLAAQYAGATYTVPVYTPNCWEAPSSLSHFEDMCASNAISGCIPVPQALGTIICILQ